MTSASLFDTHTHLGDEQFASDRAETLRRALEAGVARVVEIADSPDDWDAALALARAHPSQVRCSLGVHPYYADQFNEALLERLSKMILFPEVVAVGEIGLDYVKAQVSKEVQLVAFERLLTFCRDAAKPVVIHCRGAYEDLRMVLGRTFSGPPSGRRFWGVVHCFSGEEADALYCRDLGFALGVDGPVTYPKNEPLRRALASAGLESLVLETDCPYLPPQSSRGKRNEPAKLPEIAAKLAEACGVSSDELAARTTRNGLDLYGLV
jgi:TatD DNase family protein